MDAISQLLAIVKGWASLGVQIEANIYRGTPSHRAPYLNLWKIQVEKGLRGEGRGSAAMEDLTRFADDFGLLMTLTPDTSYGGTSVARLKRFYRRFGFVSNKGRHKDFTISDSMYRRPRAAQGS